MAGAFDRAVIDQVQRATDIVDLVSEHVNLARKGREMVGLCPFHEDHRPSLYVNPDKQIFKCFACGAGGSVFTFVQMRERLTFPQAVERLAERAGIDVKPTKTSAARTSEAEEADPNALSRANTWAMRQFQHNLLNTEQGKGVQGYIAGRGITAESTKKWQLGLAADTGDGLVKAAAARKLPMKLLEQAGLAAGSQGGGYTDKFVNRLMFPIADVTGRVIGFGGRTLDESGAKYINSPTTVLFDKSNCLYGLEQARHSIVGSGTVVVVEGYTDVIMSHQVGCANVVGAMGTSFTEGHGRILRRYAKKIVLVFDSDTAGIAAANRALEICLSLRIDIAIAFVPQGKDPCEYVLSAGKEAFESVIEQGVDVFEFKWSRLRESFSRNDTLVDRKAAIEEFLNSISRGVCSGNLSVIERGLVVNRLSRILGLTSEEIHGELARRVKRVEKNLNAREAESDKVTADLGEGLSAAAQREILEVLLNEPGLLLQMEGKITAELFDVPLLRQIADIIFEAVHRQGGLRLSDVLAQTESTVTSNVIVELARAGEQKGNFESRLHGAIEALQGMGRQEAKREIRTVEDQREFLKGVGENAAKDNLRRMGMV